MNTVGVNVWDVDDKCYIDMLSAYSAVNQGHCHPRLVRTMTEQCSRLTLPSRAFASDRMAPFLELMTSTFGYDRCLPMNTGVEGGETAVKLARRWAYEVKGVARDRAFVVFARGNFWGRTIAAISSSDDPESFGGYGPLLPGFLSVPYNDLTALEAIFREHGARIAAFMVEPIQGEAGVIVPSAGYLAGVRALCTKFNVLFIADEVQTGLGRTGRLVCCDHAGSAGRPDVLILGKVRRCRRATWGIGYTLPLCRFLVHERHEHRPSCCVSASSPHTRSLPHAPTAQALSGGMMPVSAVLASNEVMLTIKPGQHGSTFGGNPLACAVASEAVRVVLDEGLCEKATERGAQLRAGLVAIAREMPALVAGARGVGLLNALELQPDARNAGGQLVSGWDVALALADAEARVGARRGLLTKPTHENVLRLSPPLVITADEVSEALDTLRATLRAVAAGGT